MNIKRQNSRSFYEAFICDQFNKYARACNPDHIDVDANFIISWANEEGSDAIADTVSLDGDARMHFTTAVERYAELSTNQWKCLPTEKWIDLFYNTKYETGLSTIKPKPKARRNEIKNTLKGFGLDIFQFNSFPGENQLGWIARLRLFEGLDLGLVKRNKRDWFSQPTNLFRIGRLAPPLRLRLPSSSARCFLASDFRTTFIG